MTPLATALYRAFRRIVIRLGRWFARRLATRGRLWVIEAMERKIVMLRKRISRHTRMTAARRRWIQARIRIRQHAIRWLRKNARKLTRSTVKVYDDAVKHLPNMGELG